MRAVTPTLHALAVAAGGALCMGWATQTMGTPPSGVAGDNVWLSGTQVVAALISVAVFAWGAGNMVSGLKESARKQAEMARRVESLEFEVVELSKQLSALAARLEVLLGDRTDETPRAKARMSGKGSEGTCAR